MTRTQQRATTYAAVIFVATATRLLIRSRDVRRAVHALRGRPIAYRVTIRGTLVLDQAHALVERVTVIGDGAAPGLRAWPEGEKDG